MLVLTRRVGERVIINAGGKEITVSILESMGQVRLGFAAPRDVTIHREEISNRIKQQEQFKMVVGG